MKTHPKIIAHPAIYILLFLCLFYQRLQAQEASCSDKIDNDGDGNIDMFDSDCSVKSLGFACSSKFYLTRQVTSPSNATNLSTINFVSGDINVSDNISYSGLLLNASFYYDGFLYAFGHTPASNTLYQLRNNGTTVSMTITGLPSSAWNNAVCTDSGVLYMLENGAQKLWKINLKTLAVSSSTLSGISDSPSISIWGDLVIDPTTKELYCWYHPTSASSVRGLYKINLTTNTFTFMGTNSSNTMGSLFFNSTGNLYGYGSATIGGVQDRFYTINKSTGVTTQFGTPDLQVTQTDACNCATAPSVLPVELFDFNGRFQDDKTTLLSWKTASENNNDYFEIQRSRDAVQWESIGRIKGNANTHWISAYTYTDEKPYKNFTYYKLKQVDLDGNYTYSSIVTIKTDTDEVEKNGDITIYPNPTKSEIRIKIDNKTKDVDAIIYNYYGQNVASTRLEKDAQDVDLSTYPKGMYIIIIEDKLFKIFKE